MKRLSTVILAVSILILLTGCFAVGEARRNASETFGILEVDFKGQVIRDLSYGERERNVYDLYLPEDTADEKARHLILFIHGGSWTSGSKADGEIFCRNFSDHGYTSASISYTLQEKGVDPKPTILSINEEVKAAVSAIKAKCSELGIDLVDMAVSGFSAGACQALMYGFREATSSALPVKFILQQSGPTSFDPSIWHTSAVNWLVRRQAGLDGSREGDASWISMFSGKTVTADMVGTPEADAIWQEISPYTYINADSVPVLSAYGVYDSVVPPVSRTILENALDAAGKVKGQVGSNGYVTVVLDHSGHLLVSDVGSQRLYLQKVYEFCDAFF